MRKNKHLNGTLFFYYTRAYPDSYCQTVEVFQTIAGIDKHQTSLATLTW